MKPFIKFFETYYEKIQRINSIIHLFTFHFKFSEFLPGIGFFQVDVSDFNRKRVRDTQIHIQGYPNIVTPGLPSYSLFVVPSDTHGVWTEVNRSNRGNRVSHLEGTPCIVVLQGSSVVDFGLSLFVVSNFIH